MARISEEELDEGLANEQIREVIVDDTWVKLILASGARFVIKASGGKLIFERVQN